MPCGTAARAPAHAPPCRCGPPLATTIDAGLSATRLAVRGALRAGSQTSAPRRDWQLLCAHNHREPPLTTHQRTSRTRTHRGAARPHTLARRRPARHACGRPLDTRRAGHRAATLITRGVGRTMLWPCQLAAAGRGICGRRRTPRNTSGRACQHSPRLHTSTSPTPHTHMQTHRRAH